MKTLIGVCICISLFSLAEAVSVKIANYRLEAENQYLSHLIMEVHREYLKVFDTNVKYMFVLRDIKGSLSAIKADAQKYKAKRVHRW